MTYVVMQGDTLYSIAGQFGVNVPSLMQANGLTTPTALAEGQTLIIPLPVPTFPGPTPPSTLPHPHSSTRELEQRIDRLETKCLALQLEINRLNSRNKQLEKEGDRMRERVIRLEQRMDRLQGQPR